MKWKTQEGNMDNIELLDVKFITIFSFVKVKIDQLL